MATKKDTNLRTEHQVTKGLGSCLHVSFPTPWLHFAILNSSVRHMLINCK